LIEGTLRVLRDRGLAATTSRDIAAATGVNLQAITYHFGSKDELVSMALLHAVRSWVVPALDVLHSETDPAVRVLRAVSALQDAYDRGRDLVPVYLEALVHSSRHPGLREGVVTLLSEVRAFLADQIAAMKVSGALPAWVEPPAMAMLLVAAADGIALHGVLEPAGPSTHEVAAQALRLLLAAGAVRE
jgi:AcrR family transcriptional regulator